MSMSTRTLLGWHALAAGGTLAMAAAAAGAVTHAQNHAADLAEALAAYVEAPQATALPCASLAALPELDLPDLVATTLCNRQLGAIGRAELDIRQAQLDEARAGFLPTAQLSLGRAGTESRYFGEFGFRDRLSRTTAGLVMSWRAWDFGARAQRIHAAEKEGEAAFATSSVASLELAQRVLQLHSEVVTRAASIRSRESDTAVLARIVAAQDTLAARTLPAGADRHGARLRLAQHLAQLDADRAQLARAHAMLAAVIGRPSAPTPRSSTPALPAPALESLDPWLERSRRHPAVRAAKLVREAAQARADEARLARYPVIDVNAARYANRSGSTPVAGSRGVVDEFGVQVNWTLFDGFGSRSRLDAASAAATRAAHQLQDAEDEIRATVLADLAELRGVVSAHEAALSRQHAAEAALTDVRRQLAAGQGTRVDEWETELLLATATRDVQQMRLSWWSIRNRLALDTGALGLLVPLASADSP
jgi:outer membrane protein TolC